LPFGLAVLMPRAQPLTEDEAARLRKTRGFPDWDYVPPDDGCPFDTDFSTTEPRTQPSGHKHEFCCMNNRLTLKMTIGSDSHWGDPEMPLNQGGQETLPADPSDRVIASS